MFQLPFRSKRREMPFVIKDDNPFAFPNNEERVKGRTHRYAIERNLLNRSPVPETPEYSLSIGMCPPGKELSWDWEPLFGECRA